jgi:glycerol-3-phosphate dehydrogenase
MIRDLDALTSTAFDLLVVGGGIHGLFAAYDAAQRGLSAALVERADFGSGLSFNHQRTIHGGLRALQHGKLRKTKLQIDERRTWGRIAPHLIRPLPFLIGTYGWTTRSRAALKAGFAVHDFIGRQRNAGVPLELHLPRARLESAATTRRLSVGVAERGLNGGAIWYDYQTRHPDRLTWTVALAADRAGARLANYAEAVAPLQTTAGRMTGARVRDGLTGREFDVEASVVLLAAGSTLGQLMQAFGATGAPPLLRAMNLLLDRPARDIATAAPAPSGRMLTAVPWRGFVLVGTDQSDELVAEPETKPPAEAVETFLRNLNAAFPKLSAQWHDVRLVHHGLVPALVHSGRADLLPDPRIVQHAAEGLPHLVSLVGTKFTTARWAAERGVDRVCSALGRSPGRCRTGSAPLPHANVADVEGRLAETQRDLRVELDRDQAEHLSGWYGTEASEVVRSAVDAGLLDRLSTGTPVLCGEIAYAVDSAAAVHLSDAVLRRTPLGSAGHPGREALTRAADIMGQKLGWDAERRAEEIALVEDIYPNRALGTGQ